MRILVVFLYLGFSFTGCSSLLYHPTDILYEHPDRLGIQHEVVKIKSDEHQLFAWRLLPPASINTKGRVIFFHGNAENRSSHFLASTWLLKEGFEVLIFDYRGYGDSEGESTPENTIKDGLEFLSWSEKNNENSALPIFILGQSLGGAVALRTLIEYENHFKRPLPMQYQGVILDSTFISYQRAALSVLSSHWITFLFQPFAFTISDRWAPASALDRIPKISALVLHGSADRIIDPALGQDLFTALPGQKKWVLIPEGQHIDSFYRHNGQYQKLVLQWLLLQINHHSGQTMVLPNSTR
jgi:fermentation-respiration switch protein FrsA (DUF1100 family)